MALPQLPPKALGGETEEDRDGETGKSVVTETPIDLFIHPCTKVPGKAQERSENVKRQSELKRVTNTHDEIFIMSVLSGANSDGTRRSFFQLIHYFRL